MLGKNMRKIYEFYQAPTACELLQWLGSCRCGSVWIFYAVEVPRAECVVHCPCLLFAVVDLSYDHFVSTTAVLFGHGKILRASIFFTSTHILTFLFWINDSCLAVLSIMFRLRGRFSDCFLPCWYFKPFHCPSSGLVLSVSVHKGSDDGIKFTLSSSPTVSDCRP